METAKAVSPSTTDVWLNTRFCICETLGLHSSNTAPLMVPSAAREGTRANAARRRPLGPSAGNAASSGRSRAGRQAGSGPRRGPGLPLPPLDGRAAPSASSSGGAGPGRAGHVQCLREIFARFAFFSFLSLPSLRPSRPGCPSPSETVPG